MQKIRLRFLEDFNLGLYGGTQLDTVVNVSRYQHPAILSALTRGAGTTYTGPQLFAGSAGATLSGGNAWINLPSTGGPSSPQVGMLYTSQAADYLQIPITTEAQMDLVLASAVRSGQGYHSGDVNLRSNVIRNGAIVQILVDGVITQTLDLWNQPAVKTSLYFDGNAHTVRIKHTGNHNAAFNPLGAITNTVGTTIKAGLVLTAATASTLKAGTWRVTALSSGTYSLEYAAPYAVGGSPSYSTVQATLNTATTYAADSTHVPGFTLRVNGTLTTGDSATFVTDTSMIAVESAVIYATVGSASGTYSTAVLDSGDPNTQWFLAEWDSSAPNAGIAAVASVAAHTGNSLQSLMPGNTHPPNPLNPGVLPTGASNITNTGAPVLLSAGVWQLTDGIGSPVTLTTYGSTQLPVAGTLRNSLGLTTAPKGRYCQLVLQFGSVGSAGAWLRDLNVYCWTPTPRGDPQVLGKIPLPINWAPGPLLGAYAGTLAAHHADVYADVQDLQAGYALGGSLDQYLAAHGKDLGLVQYSGESPSAFRARLTAFFQSRAQGGTLPFICAMTAQLVNGTPASVVTTNPAGKTICTGGNVVVQQTGALTFSVTVPPAPYAGLPTLANALAQTAITDFIRSVLTPVGSVVSIVFS